MMGRGIDATTVTAENASELGVIPRAAHDIFERIEQDKGKYEYKVYVTYMQIYLDQIYDLINNNRLDIVFFYPEAEKDSSFYKTSEQNIFRNWCDCNYIWHRSTNGSIQQCTRR
mgnify:CR=1 FL=1